MADYITCDLIGTRLWSMTMEDVIAEADSAVEKRENLLIGVANVAKVINSRKNPELRESLEVTDFNVADGLPLVWLSRFCGVPLPERVAGIDIMQRLIELSHQKSYRVFFLGAKDEVVRSVVEWTEKNYPGVQVAGCRDGYFSEEEGLEVAEQIRDSKADILFVAITPPKKEIFLKKYSRMMKVPVCHGVGGSFDVVAGVTRRAPVWMQKTGMEWLYRVMQEPKRMWKRYLITNTRFMGLAFMEILKYRLGGKKNA